MESRTWTLTALAGTLAGVGYLVPGNDLGRETLWRVTLGAALVAILASTHRHPPG